MKLLRAFAGVTLVITSVFAALLTVLSLLSVGMIPRTVENGREIIEAFQHTTAFIEEFRAANRRLPARDELEAWEALQRDAFPRIEGVGILSREQLPQKVLDQLGLAIESDYGLMLWRGEWYEYYFPWARKSTVAEASDLYSSIVLEVLMFLLLSVGLAWCAWKLRAIDNRAEEVRARCPT